MKKYKGIILIVDDDEDWTNTYKRALKNANFFMHTYANGRSAIYAIRNQGINYDLALIDLSLPDIGGDEVVKCSKIINPKTPVFSISSYEDDFSDSDGRIFKGRGDLALQIEKAFQKHVIEKRRK
ncbi:MAG: response regulator [Patescibacteria group bacterium]|jgi:DNA-binding NtrC family response regulator|nr:response regulator [Patescibacteria group bacterium]